MYISYKLQENGCNGKRFNFIRLLLAMYNMHVCTKLFNPKINVVKFYVHIRKILGQIKSNG